MMRSTKAYVVDTGALLYDPGVLYELGFDDTVVIPTAVIKELDICKSSTVEPEARAARDAARMLDQLGSSMDLVKGGQLENGTILRTEVRYKKIKDTGNDVDNRIIGTALTLKGEFQYVAIVTTDEKMRSAARANGLRARNYPFSLTKQDKSVLLATAPKKAAPVVGRPDGFMRRLIRFINSFFFTERGHSTLSARKGSRP